MKRNYRSAKFAEYLSTYAILHGVCLHPTLLIEKRDASRGFGIFVRDAVDAGTTILVLPRRSLMTQLSLRRIGVGVTQSGLLEGLRREGDATAGGLRELFPAMDLLLMGIPSWNWIVMAWQLSVELAARHSQWWGWLSSVPSNDDLVDLEQSSQVASRAIAPHLVGHIALLRQALQNELNGAFELVLKYADILPPKHMFYWAVRLLLTRSIVVPSESNSDTVAELALAPFVDLCNMAAAVSPHRGGLTVDGECGSGNAQIEFLDVAGTLPDWCRAELRGSSKHIEDGDYSHSVMLTLSKPLLPGEEALLEDPAMLFGGTVCGDALSSASPMCADHSVNGLLRESEVLRSCRDLPSILKLQRYLIPLS